MHFHEGDSIGALKRIAEADSADEMPDIVYLDPMFPARSKSAAVKKKFQLLHHLERPCSNQEEILEAADRKPSYSLAGKAVRYDCIVPPPQTD